MPERCPREMISGERSKQVGTGASSHVGVSTRAATPPAVTKDAPVINLGSDAKEQKAVAAAQKELDQMKLAMTPCYDLVGIVDEQHMLGGGAEFHTNLKDRIAKLQAIITKAKAHVRRISGPNGEVEKLPRALASIIFEEEGLMNSCELVKKFLAKFIKNDGSGLLEAFHACEAEAVEWKAGHNIVARVWREEISKELVLGRFEAVCAHFHPSSQRAKQAVDRATQAGAMRFDVADCALFVVEDIVLSQMEQVKPDEFTRTMTGSLAFLKNLCVALVDCKSRSELLIASFIDDLEDFVVMLKLDKAQLRKIKSVLVASQAAAESASAGGDGVQNLSPLRYRILTHQCGTLILNHASAFIDEHSAVLRLDIQAHGVRQLADVVFHKAKHMFDDADAEGNLCTQEFESKVAKLDAKMLAMREDQYGSWEFVIQCCALVIIAGVPLLFFADWRLIVFLGAPWAYDTSDYAAYTDRCKLCVIWHSIIIAKAALSSWLPKLLEVACVI